MVRANSTCLAEQVAVGVVGQLLAQDQDRVQRRAQLVGHVGEELGLVLRGQRQLGRLFLHRAAGLLDFLVLALHLDVALGELLRLLLELLVGLLQFALLGLQFAGELLGLLQQALGLHRRLDAIQHDADAVGELLEERHLQIGEGADRGEFDHRLDLALEQHRQHDDVPGLTVNSAELIGTASAGMSEISIAVACRRRTGRSAPRRPRRRRVAVGAVVGIGRQQPKVAASSSSSTR